MSERANSGAGAGASYSHTQSSTLIFLSSCGATIGVFVALIIARKSSVAHPGQAHALPVSGFIPVAVVLLLGLVGGIAFSQLTTRVDGGRLMWWFGPGIWRKSVAVADIATVESVRNPWWWGWGIHLTPRGWLYNVSGCSAVEVTLNTGRRFRLGTDEPDALAQAIAGAQ